MAAYWKVAVASSCQYPALQEEGHMDHWGEVMEVAASRRMQAWSQQTEVLRGVQRILRVEVEAGLQIVLPQ